MAKKPLPSITLSSQLKNPRSFSRWNDLVFRRMFPEVSSLLTKISHFKIDEFEHSQESNREEYTIEKREEENSGKVIKELHISDSLAHSSFEESQNHNKLLRKIISAYDTNGFKLPSFGSIFGTTLKILKFGVKSVWGILIDLVGIFEGIGAALGEKLKKWLDNIKAEVDDELSKERAKFEKEVKDAREKVKDDRAKLDHDKEVFEKSKIEAHKQIDDDINKGYDKLEKDRVTLEDKFKKISDDLIKRENELKIRENIRNDNNLEVKPDTTNIQPKETESWVSKTLKDIRNGKESLLDTVGRGAGDFLDIIMVAIAIYDMILELREIDGDDPYLYQKVTGIITGVSGRVAVSLIYGTMVAIMAGEVTGILITAISDGTLVVPAAVVGSIVGFLSGGVAVYMYDKYHGKDIEDTIKLIVSKFPFRKKLKRSQRELEANTYKSITNAIKSKSQTLEVLMDKSAGLTEGSEIKKNIQKQIDQEIKDISDLIQKQQEVNKHISTTLAGEGSLISYNPDMTISKLIFEANKISFIQNGETLSSLPKTTLASYHYGQSYSGGGNDYSGSDGHASKVGVAETGDAKRVIDFFISQGWTPEQAAGIAANIWQESSFRSNGTGDPDKNGVPLAYGLGQWHSDRQKLFKDWAKKDIHDSTFDEQMAFIQYELTHSEAKAGHILSATKTAEQAAAVIDEFYERSAGMQRQKRIDKASSYEQGINLSRKSVDEIAKNSKPIQTNIVIPADKNASQINYHPVTANTNDNNSAYGARFSDRLKQEV